MKFLWSAGEYKVVGIMAVLGTLVFRADVCGTGGCMLRHRREEPSAAVSYLPNQVYASYSADAEQSQLGRARLAKWQARVDGICDFYVMTLVAATWASATAGPLHSTPVDQKGNAPAHRRFSLNRCLHNESTAVT
jgi:hypothetical protein